MGKPNCTDANSLMDSLNYLSGGISSVESYDIVDEEVAKKLVSSLIVKRKELIDGIHHLVRMGNQYEKQLNSAADQVIEKLERMTDRIFFDTKTAKLFNSKISDVKDAQVAAGCQKIDEAYNYVLSFNTTIEDCKKTFTNAVSPNLMQIFKGFGDITTNYNEADADLDKAKNDIAYYEDLIQVETEAVKSKVADSLNEFENCIAKAGVECNMYFRDFYTAFQLILNN